MGADERSGEGGEAAAASTPRPLLSVDIVTLFPNLFASWLTQGVVSRALERGLVDVLLTNLRRFGVGRHQITDDYPFGGGPGMVLKPEPLAEALDSLDAPPGTPIILLSPRGATFDQRSAEELARLTHLVLVAGHYEGIDERVRDHLITDELSIGDYILSSGELAAMVVTDAVVRLVPGVLAAGSTVEESFSSGLLEYPQYTRPAEYRGWPVPEILLSGNHGEIARWRRRQALYQTWRRRPDLIAAVELSPQEQALVVSWEQTETNPA